MVLKKRSSADGYDYDVYLQKAWEYFKRENQIIMDKQSVWNLGFSFIKGSAYFEEKGFAGFCMGLTWQSGGWRPKKDYLEIGWVGQHASLAVSLIYKALIDGESADLEKGLKAVSYTHLDLYKRQDYRSWKEIVGVRKRLKSKRRL